MFGLKDSVIGMLAIHCLSDFLSNLIQSWECEIKPDFSTLSLSKVTKAWPTFSGKVIKM